MEAIEYVELPADSLLRIGEVDRTESITALYFCARPPDGRSLQLKEVAVVPPQTVKWSAADVRVRIDLWQPELAAGGSMFGALSGDRLTGFAIVGPKRPDGAAELTALFIDTAYRGRGVGTRLYALAEERARRSKATGMVIHSNPTVSCVEFYLARGARVVRLTDDRVVRGFEGGRIVLAHLFDRPPRSAPAVRAFVAEKLEHA